MRRKVVKRERHDRSVGRNTVVSRRLSILPDPSSIQNGQLLPLCLIVPLRDRNIEAGSNETMVGVSASRRLGFRGVAFTFCACDIHTTSVRSGSSEKLEMLAMRD